MSQATIPSKPDVVLIGAGIMSATLGTMLKELEPSLTITMLETLDDCGQESSKAWNNAGTGHAANCELNYTPQRPDGSVDISRAIEVNVEFDLSRQLWAYLVKKGAIADPRAFIHPCPHMSFVWGKENVEFLKARYKAMSAHHCYHGMEYSEDRKQIADWAPLIIDGRDENEPIAATRIVTGTDVDYGSLTHLLVAQLVAQAGFSVHYKQRVVGLEREGDGRWRVEIEDVDRREIHAVSSKIRFHRRRRWSASTAGEVAHPRGARLRRLPGERDLAALRPTGGQRPPPRQGLRQGRGGIATYVRSAPRYSHYRGRQIVAVWAVCRVFDSISQARLAHGPVSVN
jgi:malate dehydrogenase (quinone)